MEEKTIDFASALIEDLKEDSLFDSEEIAGKKEEDSSALQYEPKKEAAPDDLFNRLMGDHLKSSAGQAPAAPAPQVMPPPAIIESAPAAENTSQGNVVHTVEFNYGASFEAAAKAPEDLPENAFESASGTAQESAFENIAENTQNDAPQEKNEGPDEYKKAMEEVNSLQSIEQIFYGVERDQLKKNSIPYDTLALKMALHSFQKGQPDAAEKVYSEIEKWQSYLIDKDEYISLRDLRLYCENANPKLSPRAMLTLADFYQNYSRAKFEMLVTGVFSRDIEKEQREIPFETKDVISHLDTICKNSLAEADEKVSIAKIKRFISEAEEFESFSGMLATEFFNRYQNLKIELGLSFFSTGILAAIIEANVEIGNRFIGLVAKEKAKSSLESTFDNKENFGQSFEDSISEAIGKTIELDKIEGDISLLKPKKSSRQLAIEKNRAELANQKANPVREKKPRYKKQEEESGTIRLLKLGLIVVFLTIVIVAIGSVLMVTSMSDSDEMTPEDIRLNTENRKAN